MSGEPISAEVKAFIARQIRSIVELECLLLLHQDPARDWSASELGKELRIDEKWTTQELADLSKRGLVAPSEASSARFRYAPANTSLKDLVDSLASHYAQRRVSVIELIYLKPPDPLQNFADAFRFRKESNDG